MSPGGGGGGGAYSFRSCSREASAAHLVRSFKEKVTYISSPYFVYTYRVSIAWLVMIFSNFWKTRWPPEPIFHKYYSTNYSNAVQAIVSRFDVQVSNHNTSWYWFAAISKKQNSHHRQFSENIVLAITPMPFKLSSPDLTCR